MRNRTTRRARSLAVAVTALLAAGALPLVASPAQAADACLSEKQPTDPVLGLPVGSGCDDIAPPETTIDSDPVTGGWVRATSITIAFSGKHTDADTDPISFECQFFNTQAAPTKWDACTSPVSYDNLEENGATPYTFRVRAVDTPDNSHDLTTDPFFPADTDLPDFDQSPAELTFRADASPPNTFGFLRSSYYDEDHEDAPMVTTRSVQIRLQTNEGDDESSAFRCRLNDKAVDCNGGLTTLGGLAAGLQRFSAAAVDPAGNADPTPFEQKFFVPRNLTTSDANKASRNDWRRIRGAGSFAGDYLESKKYGATLSFPVRNVREVRLLAPAGPGLGKVEIRVGRGPWMPVRLSSKDPQRLKVYQVRDVLSGLVAGPLQIRVASRGKPVRVDAVVAR